MKMSSVQESEVRTLLKNKCTADRLPICAGRIRSVVSASSSTVAL